MVSEEALFLLLDRQTVRPLRPIAAVSSVRVRLNGVTESPSPGVVLPAQATGAKAGPYNIRSGVNDQLVVKIDQRNEQVLTAPSGNQLSAIQVATALNKTLRDAMFDVTARKQLRLITAAKGLGATIFVNASGSTLASTLGMPTNRGWHGQTTVPGWSIVNDPNTLLDRPTRLIVFDDPLKGFSDYVELDYATIRQECRRCGGLGIENDWRYDGSGQVVKAQNETLLIQELLKATYTVQGSNPFHPAYGTQIINTIGRKQSASGLVQNMIVSEIYQAFNRWQSIKRQQEENVGQTVTDEEYPFRLLSVGLQQSDQDPTVIFVNATVQNRSSKPVQIERGLRLPNQIDIMSTTQQDRFFAQPIPNNRLIE
jgi:phage baseplate assembly protein W